jgi:hypothetical protein
MYRHEEFVSRCLGFPLLFRSTRTLSLFLSLEDSGVLTVRGTVVYSGGGFAILAGVVLVDRGVVLDHVLVFFAGGAAVGERIEVNLTEVSLDALRFVFGPIEVLDRMDSIPIVRDWVYSFRGAGE